MSKEILLNDLLNLSEAEMTKAKIKFHSWNGSVNPIDEYLTDHDLVNNKWLFWRNKRGYFNVGQIAICLVHMSADKWLLTTIKKITKERRIVKPSATLLKNEPHMVFYNLDISSDAGSA